MAQLVKNPPAMRETRVWSLGGEDSLEKGRLPSPVFWPGEFHGQRSLAGYNPRGCKELDTTEWLSHTRKRHYTIYKYQLLTVKVKLFVEGARGPLSRNLWSPTMVEEGNAERSQAVAKVTSRLGIKPQASGGKTSLGSKSLWSSCPLHHLSGHPKRHEHAVPEPFPNRNHPLAWGTVKTSGNREEKSGVRLLGASAGFWGSREGGQSRKEGFAVGESQLVHP